MSARANRRVTLAGLASRLAERPFVMAFTSFAVTAGLLLQWGEFSFA